MIILPAEIVDFFLSPIPGRSTKTAPLELKRETEKGFGF
jgi:hypothetical protein